MIDLAPPFLEGAAATPPTGLGEAAEIPDKPTRCVRINHETQEIEQNNEGPIVRVATNNKKEH
jgi:hypothetical protein